MNKFFSWYIKELEAQELKKQFDQAAKELGIERYADNDR